MRSKSVARIVWSLVLGCLMLGLAACGSKEPQTSESSDKPAAAQSAAPASAPASAQAKLNAAEFLTKADAEAILGKPVGDAAMHGDGVITSNCTYISSDLTSLNLLVRTGTTAQSFDEAQAASKSISTVDPVPVEGLGEKAYWAGGRLNQLNVLKNQKWLIISQFPAKENALDTAKQTAQKVLAHMP